MSAPARVRRFLNRFMFVPVLPRSIETPVLVFRVGHDAPEHWPYEAAVGLVAAVLVAALGILIHFNCRAEELEPEAMALAKQEDETRE
ncbi:hypothetical protein [Thiocystis violacea]|uniref:hypothetical protein n=1 Tax=Thiocystis violacea TaxID=13725 RepID=UPI0019054B45|nr:hypothetical protein [Thiocystis violacea]MBK1717026.1 hypothetical protein [Thiocystis violacea]